MPDQHVLILILSSARSGISEYIIGHLEQVGIGSFALFFVFCIHNGQHAAFGTPGMVAKAGNLDAEIIPELVR